MSEVPEHESQTKVDDYAVFKDKDAFIRLGSRDRFRVFFNSSIFNRISVVLGLGCGVIVVFFYGFKIVDDGPNLLNSIMHKQGMLGVVSIAYAQGTKSATSSEPVSLKNVIIFGFCAALFILFIWSLHTLSTSTNARAIDIAADAVKTLAGFFIGAVTGFLG